MQGYPSPKTRTQTSPSVWRGIHSIEAWTQPASLKKRGGTKIMHIFVKIGGRKVKGGRKTKLLEHNFAPSSSYFLKNFLARYARSITFYFHPPIRGHGTYTARTVKSVSLLKVGKISVDFPSCTFDDLMSPN